MKNLPLLLLSMCCWFVSDARAQDADQRFSRMDRNGDGVLDKDEIPEQLRERIMRLDANGDGQISREEMQAGRNRQGQNRQGENRQGQNRPGEDRPQRPGRPNAENNSNNNSAVDRFQQLLKRADKDGNGKLELSELPEQLRQRLARLDSNGDGVIDKTEFQAATRSAAGRSTDPPGGGEKGADQRLDQRGAGQRGNPQEGMARFQNLLKELPKDDNGRVDLKAIPEESRRKRLSQFDTNNDGLLDPTELRQMAQNFRGAGADANRPRGENRTPNAPGKPGASGKGGPGKGGQLEGMKDKRFNRESDGSPQRPQRPKSPGATDGADQG